MKIFAGTCKKLILARDNNNNDVHIHSIETNHFSLSPCPGGSEHSEVMHSGGERGSSCPNHKNAEGTAAKLPTIPPFFYTYVSICNVGMLCAICLIFKSQFSEKSNYFDGKMLLYALSVGQFSTNEAPLKRRRHDNVNNTCYLFVFVIVVFQWSSIRSKSRYWFVVDKFGDSASCPGAVCARVIDENADLVTDEGLNSLFKIA